MQDKLKTFFQNKTYRIISICAAIILLMITLVCVIYNIAENRRIDAEALTLNENLSVEFNTDTKVSDFIANLNGELISDPEVDTTKLGEQEISFEFYNIKHKKRTRKFTIDVVDTTKPEIYGNNFYVVETNYDGDLTNLMMSGDNADDRPERKVSGNYDLRKPGDYQVEYIITDASENVARRPFTLRVIEPVEDSDNSNDDNTEIIATPISDVIEMYKTDTTKIGIDVSYWQGNIDWQKAKSAGVEFAFIRVGYQADFGNEYTLDKKFIDNIKGATKVGLPVGVYFYSCADSIDEARRQAEWVIDQIKDYNIKLGVAFDWEEWRDFNRAGMSFYTLNQAAQTFIDTVSDAGYGGLLYGSKNYIEKFWQQNPYKLWLAQYHDYVTYKGEYYIWQLMDTGSVPGISGYVDLDIMYLPKD